MNGTITEKNYPVRNIWLFEGMMTATFIVLICVTGGYLIFGHTLGVRDLFLGILLTFIFFSIITNLVFCITLVIDIMRRSRFHYSLDEHFLTLHQGIISKQNRNIPYGRIQEISVHQTLSDRIFGLASLTIQDFSQGGSEMDIDGYVGSGKSRHEIFGFVSDGVHIPGLKKEDAETLKTIILQKIKENPIEDSQSGL
jgi:membrane protein YdbS with pleckstrin-like domain